eukprot:Nitzschia sp. Nitz4//scaffold48_size128905//82912//83827//NITZ4_003608-RA/size128905-augustus-gene-0.25-mRNA-1//-1//CDS//3329553006//3348//frame0
MKHNNQNLVFWLCLALCFSSGRAFLVPPLASSKLLPVSGCYHPGVQVTPNHGRTALHSLFSGTQQTAPRQARPTKASPQEVKSKGRLRTFFSSLFRRISAQWTCFMVMIMVMRSSPVAATEMSALAHQDSMYVMEQAQVASRLENLVGKYVQTHMFSDESIDVASDIYREVSNDAAHHKKLSSITMSLLGQSATNARAVRAWHSPGQWLRTLELYLARRGVSRPYFVAGGGLSVIFIFYLCYMFFGWLSARADRDTWADWRRRFGDDFTFQARYKWDFEN